MSQNFAARIARLVGGGIGFLNLSNNGSLKTINDPAEYETVAASQTKQVLGATGAAGDVLASVTIVPATTSPGAVTLYDGASGAGIPLFTGGATSVADLRPITISLGVESLSNGWRISTGANVSVVAVGDFT